LRDEEHAGEVRVNDVFPELEGNAADGYLRLRDASVVDENAELAEAPADCKRELAHGGGIANVTGLQENAGP
jgi:hypothetical protein